MFLFVERVDLMFVVIFVHGSRANPLSGSAGRRRFG
jgi:hypothetical protein